MQLMTFKQALHQALDEELEENENVILMGEDIGVYGGVEGIEKGLLEKYGKSRILSTPNSESTVIGAAVGAAAAGLVPVVEVNSGNTISVGVDALVNQAANMSYFSNGEYSIPMVVRFSGGGDLGEKSGVFRTFESLFANVPGLKVVAPTTPAQAKGLLKAAIEDKNPVVFLENKALYDASGPVPEEKEFSIPLSTSVIEREGNDVTIVAWGPALMKVGEVLGILEREGISAEIINPLTLYPMDMEPIYDSVTKTSRLVIVHDGAKTGGIGAEIAAKVAESECFDYLDAPIKRVAGEDVSVPFNRYLQQEASPKKEDILDAVYTVTGMN